MNDLRTLSDAFAELERRADAAPARLDAQFSVRSQTRHRSHLLAVAAGVVATATVAGGVAALASDHHSGGHATTTAPAASQQAAGATHRPAPRPVRVPTSSDELAKRLRSVLGDTARFTVTDTGAAWTMRAPSPGSRPAPQWDVNGAAIVGTLTASGATGGFDLQIFRTQRRATAWCDNGITTDPKACTVTRLADGSSLAIGRQPLEGGGVTYEANLIHPDGVELLMHVSNQRSPKGDSTVIAARPPMTTEQMTDVLSSPRW